MQVMYSYFLLFCSEENVMLINIPSHRLSIQLPALLHIHICLTFNIVVKVLICRSIIQNDSNLIEI